MKKEEFITWFPVFCGFLVGECVTIYFTLYTIYEFNFINNSYLTFLIAHIPIFLFFYFPLIVLSYYETKEQKVK